VSADESTSRAVSGQDAEALLNIVIELEAFLIDDSAPELVTRLTRRLRRAGLVSEGHGRPELRLALSNLNLRLRYAVGEFEEAPQPDIGLVDHYISFDSTEEALRFGDLIRALGMWYRQDVPAGSGRVRMVATTSDLLLSQGFDAAQKHIEQAAVDCGGTYEGFGGPGSPEGT